MPMFPQARHAQKHQALPHRHQVASRLLCLLLLLTIAGTLLAEQDTPYINGNFQPKNAQGNDAPEDWWINTFGLKRKDLNYSFSYSKPDADGYRTMTVNVPQDARQLAIYGMGRQILPVVNGDLLTYTGEVRGTGTLRAGFYGYNLLDQNISQLTDVPLTPDWKPFQFSRKIMDGSGDGSCYIRSALHFNPGTTVSIRHLKLHVNHTDQVARARKGHRYFPVYKITEPLTLNLQQDRKIWETLPVGRGFIVHKTDEWQQEHIQTDIQMAHDGTWMYLKVNCREPDTDYIRFNEQDIQKALNSVELALSSKRGAGIPHPWYTVNTKGTLRFQNTAQTEHTVKADITPHKNGWTVQFKLGLKGLLLDGEKLNLNQDYFFNVGRVDSHPKGRRLSSFAPSGFGTPDNFTILSFLDSTPKDTKIIPDHVLNGPYYRYLRNQVANLAKRQANDWKNIYGTYGTVNGANLEQALKLSERARQNIENKERNWKTWQSINRDAQALHQILTKPVRQITLDIHGVSLIRQLTVNGATIPLTSNGLVPVTIQQGANLLTATLKAGGKVNLTVKDHPETRGRWRTAPPQKNSAWTARTFDDRNWPMAKTDQDGAFQTFDGCIRQIIFWEHSSHGDYRLTIPQRRYGFSQNGYEQMILFLDSPLTYPLNDFTITWELPGSIQILNRNTPLYTSVTSQPLAGKTGYRTHTMAYRNRTANVGERKLRKEHLMFKVDDKMPVNTDFTISYSRAAGNVVELKQSLPCRILPPVNGRITRNILWMPGIFSPVPPHAFKDFCHHLYRAGLNTFTYYVVPPSFIEETRGKPVTFMYNTCYPMDGAGWGIKGALFDLVKQTPNAQAHFFDQSVTWGGLAPKGLPRYMNNRETTRFCLTWAAEEGRRDFVAAVRKDVETMLQNCPDARIFWNNWERHVSFGKLERCFCPRCLKKFARVLQLTDGQALNRETIKQKYANEWKRFQYQLDAQILGLVTEAVQGLGMQFMAYNGTGNQEAWKAANGKMLFNPGCPGNGLVTSRNQKALDNAATFFAQQCGGVKVLIGQIILPNVGWSSGRFDYTVDAQGFYNPELLKNAIVRQTAALHGGTRLDASMGGGTLYYLGEATRLIAAFEPLFHRGSRQDTLARSPQLAYPNLLVLTRKLPRRQGSERLVLLFNEDQAPKSVTLENLDLPPKTTVRIWEGTTAPNAAPAKMDLVIPPRDVTAVYLRLPDHP